MRRWSVFGLSLGIVTGCSSVPTSVLLHIEAASGVGAVEQVQLSVFDATHVAVDKQRRPEAPDPEGVLPSDVVLFPPTPGALRVLVHAYRGGAFVGEGAALVSAQESTQVSVTIVVRAGRLPDADKDGVPDDVDNCPDVPNPEQKPCRRDGGVDAGDGSVDGDGQPPRPDTGDGEALPDGPGPDTPCPLQLAAYVDGDGDGVGRGAQVSVCAEQGKLPAGYSDTSDDCDDNDSTVWRQVTAYPDLDGDGVGSPRTRADWRTGSQTGNDTAGGTVNWSSTSAVGSSDNNRARVSLMRGEDSAYLTVTDFGFSIPSDASIDGIVVEVERSATGSIDDNAVRLIKGGAFVGNNLGSGSNWPSSDDTAYYGGSSNDWNASWTPSDINSSGFGVGISAHGDNGGSPTAPRDALIDRVRIRVYYRFASGGAKLCIGSSLPSGYVNNSSDCDFDDGTQWQLLTGYPDGDGDGYNSKNPTQVCSGSSLPSSYSASPGTDCYDQNANARPNQTAYFASHRGDGSYDYNCDGSESRENITGRCLVSAVTAYAGLKSGSTGATCTVASGSLRICTGSTTSSETSCGATWYEVNSNYYYADSACATLIGPGVSTETQRCR